ncbi:MAG: Sensor histidine kinase RcsC [Saprospiraceae bacterium]|nr:Sensor histidine kinase RcsC [Saprospiraceae bacterium]
MSALHSVLLSAFHILMDVFISFSCFSQASTVRFRHLSVEDGLTSNYVTCMMQDQKGLMWIGGWKGLDCYDGYHFKKYKHDPKDAHSLGAGGVYAVLEDGDGVLWVGLSAGLDRYDPVNETFTHYLYNTGNSPDATGTPVLCLFEDQSGQLWAGTTGGLFLIDKNSGKYVQFRHDPSNPNSLSDNFVSAICQADNGQLWVGTRNGLNQFDPATGKFQRFQKNPETSWSPTTVSHSVIVELVPDQNGLLYIGSKGGLDIYDPQQNPASFRRVFRQTFAIWRDTNDGALWLGTPEGLFRQFGPDTSRMEAYYAHTGVPDGLSSSFINCLFQDREGTLWIGTDNGINLLTPEAFQFRHHKNHPDDPNSLSQNRLKSVFAGPNGSVWIGTNGAGLNKLDPHTGKVQRFPYKNGEKPDATCGGIIFSVLEDRYGIVWAGLMSTGLDRLEIKKGRFSHVRWNDRRDLVSYIYEGKDGVLWLGHQGGVSRYDRAADTFAFASCAPAAGRKGNLPVVTGILQDPWGAFWVSSNGLHLNRFDPKTMQFKPYTHAPGNPNSVASNNIQSIYCDGNGQLWVGTDKGLDLYDRNNDSFWHFGLADGLPDLMMGQMAEDGRGRLWIATGKGITRFDPVSRTFRNYDKSDGLSSNESWDFAKDPVSGAMCIATADGLTIFHPDSLRDNPIAPAVVFTKFSRYDSKTRQQVEEKGISEKSTLSLSYFDDILTFEFAALSFRKPEKNQYAYKLGGYNEEWIPLGTKREVTFTNLDPGSYVLKVKASNGDGVWNEEGTSLKIIISPPWWMTWWAYLFYLLLISGSIYALYRFQLKRKLAAAETRRLKELDTFKSRFYTNITHEFRTPLTVIGGMVEQIRANPGKWLEEGLDMIQRNSRSLLRLVNQMLDLSKLESGSLPVHLIRDDVLLYLKYLCESFHSFAESKNIQLQFETDLKTCNMDYDPEKLEQIISNLLSNAIRFTPEGGTVKLNARLQSPTGDKDLSGDYLEIRVSDTGIGIPQDQLPFIFDRFYQVEYSNETQREGGTGIGLALTKELIKLLDGRIKAGSTPGEGAVFAIWLPLRQQGIAAAPVSQLTPVQDENKARFERPSPSKAGKVSGQSLKSGTHILLVEDHADVVRYLTACLGEQYRLSVASDGIQGMEQALEHIPDLIISDVMMPRMDGFELCATLKRDDRSSHIPIILLTAKGDISSKLEGLQHGADTYLIKPFNKQELLVRVQNLLELRRSLQAHYLALAASSAAPGEPDVPPEENTFVLKVRGIVEARLTDPHLDVENLCREVGMSSSNLHRKLTALTGYSANRFIRYIRLTKARTLLSDPELTIVAVAFDCGFNDPVYFARAFRQEFGISPSEYRHTKGR